MVEIGPHLAAKIIQNCNLRQFYEEKYQMQNRSYIVSKEKSLFVWLMTRKFAIFIRWLLERITMIGTSAGIATLMY